MSATAGRLAQLTAEHGVKVTARSTAAGQQYRLTGGTKWGRRVVAALIRNALYPAARVHGVTSGASVVLIQIPQNHQEA